MATDTETAHDHDHDHDEPPRTNALVRRGFGDVTLAHENSATQALIAKATADIQARWIMAMRQPRDIAEVRQMILKECKRPGFAKVAIYAVPRGEKQIRGLSIRFAEVAMRCMSNMGCEAQTIFDSDDERIVRITATDFETNATWSRDITIKKTVERKFLKRGQRPRGERVNSYGDRVYIVDGTDDDVATKESSAISKAARTAILRLIPGHIQDEAFHVCETIAKEEAAKDPDGEANKILDAFAELNVMPSALAEWLGHPFDQTTPAELVELRKLYTGLREGDLSWTEALETAGDARERAKKAAAERKAAAPAPAGNAAPASSPPPASGTATSTPATSSAPTSSTPPANSPPTTAKAPPASAPPPAADQKAQPARTGGRGSQAVKDKISGNAPATSSTSTRDAQPASAPAPAPAPAPNHNMHDPNAEPPPDVAPPALHVVKPADDDLDVEERKCAKCGVPIETLKSDPPGAKCYACRQGD
jgi:hypothetical protein